MSEWDKKADEEIVIYHIMRRDRLAARERLTPRMEARQIIDALDRGRKHRTPATLAKIQAKMDAAAGILS